MVGRDEQSWHLEKEQRFMGAADRAFAVEDWETAISRAYYGLYHAVIAVLATKAGIERPRWDHIQLQRDFRAHFARRGFLFNVRDAGDFESLLEARIAADYGRERISERSAINLRMRAFRLYERINEAI